jgi:nitrogen fixation protein
MVQFTEAKGSPKEHYSWTGMKAERKLFCLWEDRHALVEMLLGTDSEFDNNGPATYPGVDGTYAMNIDIESFVGTPEGGLMDEASNIANYDGKKAMVDVRYETLVTETIGVNYPDIEEYTLVTYEANAGGEVMLLNGAALHWQANDDYAISDDTKMPKRIMIIDHSYHWRRLNSIPYQTIRAAGGCINNATFLGTPAGTVLFDGAAITAEYILSVKGGSYQAKWYPGLKYSFKERVAWHETYAGRERLTWNHIWRENPIGNPAFDVLLANGTNAVVGYESADLSRLFYYGE